MALSTIRTKIRRFTWDLIPPIKRVYLKSACASLLGSIQGRRPQVEVFGVSAAAEAHNQLRTLLEEANVNAATELCRIMTRYGSDKGAGRHNYTTVYHRLFANLRSNPVALFELGIGTNNPNLASSMGVAGKPGASLRGWAEYFRSGQIFGADIDPDILFDEGRIKTFHCDQLKKDAIDAMWAKPPLRGEFDIVIEDGLHTFEANESFLENSLHKIRKGGYYIIEDVRREDLPRWRQKLQSHYSAAHSEFSFFVVTLPWLFNVLDNNLVVAHRR